jgi:heme/copper-type cytochrome/quinol oxidase subunit 2
MKFLLAMVFILNVLDAILTSLVVGSAIATEANPLMRSLLNYGIVPFITVKLSVIISSIYVLWKYRKRKIAKYGAIACAFIYTILITYVICAILYPSYIV